jgi:hypothetical protein
MSSNPQILRQTPRQPPQPRSDRAGEYSVVSPLLRPATWQLPIHADRVALDVTILPALLGRLRSAIEGDSGVATVLTLEPLRRSECFRVRIGVERSRVTSAILTVIRALPSGQIGRVSRL